MPADVRSIQTVLDWRADLANYGEILAEAMAGVDLELRRAFDWLEEQLALWKRAVRTCEEDVVRAKAELSQREYQTFDGRTPDCTVQEKNLRVAKARLEHAQDKVELVRRWIGRLPKMIDEVHTGPSRRLKSLLEAAVPNAVAELGRRAAALEAYADLRPDYAPAPSAAMTPREASGTALPTPPAPLPSGRGESASLRDACEDGSDASSAARRVSPFPSGRGAGGVGETTDAEHQPPTTPPEGGAP